jgi:predicted permease
MLQDVRYGVRRLVRQPGFTAVAVLTLALGIGANTAIFSAVRAVLLQTLPVRDPERLVLFSESTSEGTMSGDPVTGDWELFSYPSYEYFKAHSPSFENLAAFRSGESQISVIGESGSPDGQAQVASSHLVSGDFFTILGAEPLLGRTITAADDVPGAAPVAVLSYGHWRSHFGGDPSAVGRTVTANGVPLMIVGVMRPEFFGVRVRSAPNYWIPMQLHPRIEFREPVFASHTAYWINVIGRLRPGASLEQAQSDATAALQAYLSEQAGTEITPDRQEAIANTSVALAGGGRGISGFREQYTDSLWVLSAGVALIMLIACANIANLLLARGAARKGEMAVRLALGASSSRLNRQLLTEGILLALAGGAVGVLFADWGVHLLVRLVAQDAPLEVSVNPLVLGFTAGLSLAAGLLFSLAPAWRGSRVEVGATLKERSQNASGGSRRLSLAPALVAAQVALSLILLMGAGLLTRSLVRLQGQDVGFNHEGVLLARIMPRLAGYDTASLRPLYRQLIDQLSNVPGISSVSLATYSPMSGNSRISDVTVDGHQPVEGEDEITSINQVGPNYPQTLGLQVVAGRAIDDQDVAGAPLVAMVNQAFVDQYFPTENPIGRGFIFGDESEGGPRYEIVGVVSDARFGGVTQEPGKMVYIAMLQAGDRNAFTSELQIRTDRDPASYAAQVRAVISGVDSRLPIFQITSLDQQLQATLRRPRLLARLVAVFGVLAVLLACVGLYGVISQSVQRRTNELGIRMALGADAGRIIGMVLGETMKLILAGLAIGIPAAIAGGYLIRSQLFGVDPLDPATLAGTTVLLVLVAAAAGYLPAWRASRVDPMLALRKD